MKQTSSYLQEENFFQKLFSNFFLYSDIFGDISRHQRIGVVNEVGPSLLPERTNLA